MKYNIYLEGTVGWSISSEYVKYMLDKYKDQHVDVRLSSLGGDVVTALNIYSMFKEHGDVTVYLVGAAASAATIIACGAKKVKIDSSCLFLVHKCSQVIFKWASLNEEEIGTLIADLCKKQKDQRTIDNVIANIYSQRNGKTIDDNIAIMAEGAWLDADKAKEYGLVDEVYTIKDGEELSLSNQFRNSIDNNSNGVEKPLAAEPSVDEAGEPTESFVQKTLAKITSLFQKEQAKKEIKNMKKTIFCLLNALLCIEGFEMHEEKILMTDEQAKKIEDEITSLRDQIANKDQSLTQAQNDIKDLKDKIKLKDDEIAAKQKEIDNLNDAPGDDTNEVHENEEGGEGVENFGRELYNTVKGL